MLVNLNKHLVLHLQRKTIKAILNFFTCMIIPVSNLVQTYHKPGLNLVHAYHKPDLNLFHTYHKPVLHLPKNCLKPVQTCLKPVLLPGRSRYGQDGELRNCFSDQNAKAVQRRKKIDQEKSSTCRSHRGTHLVFNQIVLFFLHTVAPS